MRDLLAVVFLFSFSLFALANAAETDNSNNGEEEQGKNDYHIYELIERAKEAYPGSGNLYGIFGLEWGASADDIASSFRRLSIKYHPDKQKNKSPTDRKQAQSVYGLLTSVSDLLRSAVGRRRYEWILYEAPPWHKSTIYAKRTFSRFSTARYTLPQSILLITLLLVVGEYLMLCVVWACEWTWRWSSRRQVREFGSKEMKRMMRKVERSTSPAFLGMVDTNYEALNRSQAALLPFPRPWGTFPFRMLYLSLTTVFGLIKRQPIQAATIALAETD